MTPNYVGDLAAQVAQQLQDQHVTEALERQEVPDEGEVLRRDARKSIFSKIEFKWRTSDEKILLQLRTAVDLLYKEMFSHAFRIMDQFYQEMRVPEQDPTTGVVKRDSEGRVVWKRDSSDRLIEDWSQITGQDIEKCLFDITVLKTVLAPQLTDLLLEAVFAKHCFDDVRDDAYAELVEETIPGRQAYAAKKSREDKYHAFFRFCLYQHAQAFKNEIDNFSRVLERIRYWRVNEGGSTSTAIRSRD